MTCAEVFTTDVGNSTLAERRGETLRRAQRSACPEASNRRPRSRGDLPPPVGYGAQEVGVFDSRGRGEATRSLVGRSGGNQALATVPHKKPRSTPGHPAGPQPAESNPSLQPPVSGLRPDPPRPNHSATPSKIPAIARRSSSSGHFLANYQNKPGARAPNSLYSSSHVQQRANL